jgi:hypothetical protein
MILETAERQPLLQLWEDLHWADPSTLEFIGLLIDQAPTAALLIVVTARPDFIAPWQARSHITPITLNRLESQHAEALVARLADMKPLPGEVVDHIVAKADGVPLYVEELSKTILASDILRDAGTHFELTGPLSSLAIPDTLQESLMARLDRLPLVREIAQLGSVLGREFAYEMISGLSAGDDGALQEGLGQLSMPNCSISAAGRHAPNISSNMRWFRMRPIARCCGAPARATICKWRASWNPASPISSRPAQSSSPITTARRMRVKWRSVILPSRRAIVPTVGK